MEVSILVAVGEKGEIGKDNQLLWRLSDDLKLFKKRTLGHCIIMGRKTFDSIGKALPGRTNIVITRNKKLKPEGCITAYSLEKALKTAKEICGDREIFIIGGQQIFELSIPFASQIYLTQVKASFLDADTFFDISPFKDWKITETLNFKKSEKNEFDFEIKTLKRK